MLIGIDASRANEPQKTGTEWYAYHLIEALKQRSLPHTVRLYTNRPLAGELGRLPPNFESRLLTFGTDILWTQLRLSAEMAVRPPDVLFVPAHTIPLVHPPATVVTVHDLGFEYFPELYKKVPIGPPGWRQLLEVGARLVTLGRYGNNEYDYHRWATRFALRHAAHIIAVSEYTKQDLVKRFGADPATITVVPHGYERSVFRPAAPGEKPPKHILSLRPYILYVGRIERKKNIVGLLAAYRLFREQVSRRFRLVLVGKQSYGAEEVSSMLGRLPASLRRDVHLMNWVPEEEKAQLLRFADLFVFPSLFEGFGIPVIEAMASGVPVVCSNVTALPEVAGKAALLVDPKDPASIAQAMIRVTTDSRLREEMIRRGLTRANRYSWEESARLTRKVLEETFETVGRKRQAGCRR